MQTTGWPPGLLQDDSRELSRWLSTRLGARYQIQRNDMQTDQTPEALAQAIKDAAGEYANLIRMGHVADAITVLIKLIADTDRLRDDLIAAQSRAAHLESECQLATHKVITCGVAARHPDAALASTGAYAGEWDSPQAQEVRELRADRDRLRDMAASGAKDAERLTEPLTALLSLVRREAPHLSGKVMGNAEAAIAATKRGGA
jgi:hypothetical protein